MNHVLEMQNNNGQFAPETALVLEISDNWKTSLAFTNRPKVIHYKKNYILMPDSCFSKSVVRLSTCTLFLAKPSYFHIFILFFIDLFISNEKLSQISIGKLVGGKTKLIHQQFRHRQLGRDTMFPLSYL